MVLGFDIHIMGINPPQSSASSMCLALGGLEPVTLAYTPGSGNFSLVDLELTEATVAASGSDSAPDEEEEVAAAAAEGAGLAHQIQQQQEEFISTLNRITISVIGRHGKILSSSGEIKENIQVPLVPAGSYTRHTNDDKFALQNDTMLLLARSKLKIRVTDCTGPAHAASLSSYSANITLSVSVYDVNMNPNTDLRVAGTGRVIAGWKAREMAVLEANAAAALRLSCDVQKMSVDHPPIPVGKEERDEARDEAKDRATQAASAVARTRYAAAEEEEEEEEEGSVSHEWEPASPLYDSLCSSANESENEDEAAYRRVERDRREISMFFAEQHEQQQLQQGQGGQGELLAAGVSVDDWVEGLHQHVVGVRKSLELLQMKKQKELEAEEQRKLRIQASRAAKAKGLDAASGGSALSKKQQANRRQGARPSPVKRPLHSQDMNLQLDSYPKDMRPTAAATTKVKVVPTRHSTAEAREAGGGLRVGRGKVTPVAAAADTATAAAAASSQTDTGERKAAEIKASTEKGLGFLKKKGGVVGKAWRQYVTAAAHGKPKPPSRAEREKENEEKMQRAKLAREERIIAKDRDKTARLLGGIQGLGGMGHTRPVTVRASYQAGEDGKVRSSYVRSDLLPSTRAKEAQHLSATHRVPSASVPGAEEPMAAAAVEHLARVNLPVPPAAPEDARAIYPKTFDQQDMPLPPRVYDPIIYFHR